MDRAAACWTTAGERGHLASAGDFGKETPTMGSGSAGTSGSLSTAQCLDTASTSTSDGEATAGEYRSEEDEGDAEDSEPEDEEDDEDGDGEDEAEGGRTGAGSEARQAPQEAGAPAKAALGQACGTKIAEPDSATLLRALSKVLTRLASLGCVPQRSTCFHAVCPPQISIQDYLERIAKYFHCSDACLILGLVYMDRIVKLHPEFVVSTLNIHRLTLTSIVLAAKFHDDIFYANKFYATVGGVRLPEFNMLEASFLKMIKWNMRVLPEEYDQYLERVLSAA